MDYIDKIINIITNYDKLIEQNKSLMAYEKQSH